MECKETEDLRSVWTKSMNETNEAWTVWTGKGTNKGDIPKSSTENIGCLK